jgi:hypothetical protein
MVDAVFVQEPSQVGVTLLFQGKKRRVAGQLALIAGEWQALQALQKDLSGMIERLDDTFLTAAEIGRTFGITRTMLNRLAAAGKVRRKGRQRKRFAVRDVLLAVLNSGEGRSRRRRRPAAASAC